MSTLTQDRPAAPTSTDEAQIRAMINRWARALERQDLDGLTADYVPDAVLYDVKPPYRTVGVAAIRKLWSDCFPFFPKNYISEHRDLHFTVGHDVAVVHGLHHFVIPDEPNHPAGQSYIRVTACYQKIQGEWKVVHEHVSMPFDCRTGQVAPITNADVNS
jgi:uncharacterized protein (TIGR02246 family)